jgi:hypothetical protein
MQRSDPNRGVRMPPVVEGGPTLPLKYTIFSRSRLPAPPLPPPSAGSVPGAPSAPLTQFAPRGIPPRTRSTTYSQTFFGPNDPLYRSTVA